MTEIEAILEEEVKSQEDGAQKGSKRHQEEGKPKAQATGTKKAHPRSPLVARATAPTPGQRTLEAWASETDAQAPHEPQFTLGRAPCNT